MKYNPKQNNKNTYLNNQKILLYEKRQMFFCKLSFCNIALLRI